VAGAIDERVEAVLQALRSHASARIRDEMAPRYGIVTDKAMGVAMAKMQAVAKPLAPDHALAEALWETGWYEARMVACMVDDPAQVTPEQMDRWRADFDNWGIVDTVCFKLFDQVPHAPAKVAEWTSLNDEFGGWQSGLRFADGDPKPSLRHFTTPFAIDSTRNRLWGQVRTRDVSSVTVQRRTGSTWKTIATRRTDSEGYWSWTTRLTDASYRFLAAGATSATLRHK